MIKEKGKNEQITKKIETENKEYNEEIAKRFIDNNDGTITDSQTKLIWKKCTEGQIGHDCNSGKALLYTWYDVKDKFPTIESKDENGWRVPSSNELLSLVYCSNGRPEGVYSMCENKYQREVTSGYKIPQSLLKYKKPTIYSKAFPNTVGNYWSYKEPIGDANIKQVIKSLEKRNIPINPQIKQEGVTVDFSKGGFTGATNPAEFLLLRLVRENES